VLAISQIFKRLEPECLEDNVYDHSKLDEFSSGLKRKRSARFYSTFLLLRRTIFVIWLLFGNRFDPFIIVSVMLIFQILYVVALFLIRPFEQMQNNIVECLNEVFFTSMVVILVHVNTENKWAGLWTKIYVWIMMFNNLALVGVLTCKFLIYHL
jgi:hypothetical protein